MKRTLGWIAAIVVGLLIGWLLAMATVEAQELPLEGWASGPTKEIRTERLVIVSPVTGEPCIVLRSVQGQPVIILLRPGETEEKGVLDFLSGNSTSPRSILGGDRRAP